MGGDQCACDAVSCSVTPPHPAPPGEGPVGMAHSPSDGRRSPRGGASADPFPGHENAVDDEPYPR